MAPSKKSQAGNKKKGASKKQQKQHDASSSTSSSQDSTVVLSRVLTILISIMVVVAAILLKPLMEKKNGLFSMEVSEENDPESDPSQWPRPDPRVGFLVSRACLGIYKQLNFFCHKALMVSQRHFRATRRIEPGEILFEIPRSVQVWDLDALRDPWIRLHLFEASHQQSGNGVGSEAFLAVYLALQLKRKEDSRDWDMELLELAYYDVLYSFEDWANQHPILADADHIKEALGFSEGYGVLQAYRNMILSEYQAFSDFSKNFQEMVTREEYFAARLNVLTRAIRVGPPGPEHAIQGTFLKDTYTPEQLLNDELTSYKEILGIDLEKEGCIAMIPIADMFNHHPQNNVEYEYTHTELNQDGAFVVRADHRRIEQAFEPMTSYGVGIPDAHLYARYGFVNGDGSGPTQVSLAIHHDILKLNMSAQYEYFPATGLTSRLFEFMEIPVAEYLRFDDGYSDCIPGPNTHPEEADLKLLKHKHLLRIANMPERWQLSVPAANPYSYPNITHDVPIVLDPPKHIAFYTKTNLDATLPLSTCRLMSLTTFDFEGKAAQILRDNLNNETFVLAEGNDSLEYRSWMCMRRWLGTGLGMLKEDVGGLKEEFQRVYELNKGPQFGSRDWGAANVRLGEMQSLRAAASVVQDKVAERWGDSIKGISEYTSREDPCPEEYQQFLFDEMENDKYRVEL